MYSECTWSDVLVAMGVLVHRALHKIQHPNTVSSPQQDIPGDIVKANTELSSLNQAVHFKKCFKTPTHLYSSNVDQMSTDVPLTTLGLTTGESSMQFIRTQLTNHHTIHTYEAHSL